MPIKTPNIATKNSEFTDSQKLSYKSGIDLNGKDIYNLTFSGGFYNTIKEIKSEFLYRFISDITINDDDTIKDSELNEYEVYIYNSTSILANEVFELSIFNNIAYLYKI